MGLRKCGKLERDEHFRGWYVVLTAPFRVSSISKPEQVKTAIISQSEGMIMFNLHGKNALM